MAATDSTTVTGGSSSGSKPILVAIDARGGTDSLAMAGTLAARDGSLLVVVSIVEPPSLVAMESRRTLLFPWEIEQQLAERRRNVAERLLIFARARTPAHPPHVDVAYGEPGREIARLAEEHGAQLIVMGIGPHSLARRMLGEGTTWATVRHAPCAVLAVARGASGVPRHAVAAVDFRAASLHAAREGARLLADEGVMHLVHAWEPVETLVQFSELDDLNDAYVASMPERFARVRTELELGRRLAVDTVVKEGKPAEVLLAVARERRADLIVAGTHGGGRLARWVLGSTSSALLSGAGTSVLLVPEPPIAEQTRLTRHMTGTSTVRASDEWNDELAAFVERNRARRTVLEIDAANIGAQVQECGYALVGATYDRHDRHLALMFTRPDDAHAHLTRSLRDVTSVSVAAGANDLDRALRVESAEGSALLTFLDPPRSGQASAHA